MNLNKYSLKLRPDFWLTEFLKLHHPVLRLRPQFCSLRLKNTERCIYLEIGEGFFLIRDLFGRKPSVLCPFRLLEADILSRGINSSFLSES